MPTDVIGSDQPESARKSRANLRDRARAAGLHLLISMALASAVLALTYLAWYPTPLAEATGVGTILVVILAVDVTIGPLLTFCVFDRRKRSLPFDLAAIALLQLGALGYGLYTVEKGRPEFLVFVKDRFEVISRADISDADRESGSSNPAAQPNWWTPKLVAARIPAAKVERERIMFESVAGGRDVQNYPNLYVDLASQLPQLREAGHSMADLRKLNPGRIVAVDHAVAHAGLDEDNLAFLPIKGPRGDAVMLIDRRSGQPAGMADLQPW